jgi:hypothetical protein
MTHELVDRLAILVAARRFRGMGVANYRLLRYDSCVRTEHFVRRSTISFRRFWGDVRREVMQRVFIVVLHHGILGSYLREVCRRAVLMLWPAFLFLGHMHVGFFLLAPFCLVASAAFSYCKRWTS